MNPYIEDIAVITRLQQSGAQNIQLKTPVAGIIEVTKVDDTIIWHFDSFENAKNAADIFRSTEGISSAQLIHILHDEELT